MYDAHPFEYLHNRLPVRSDDLQPFSPLERTLSAGRRLVFKCIMISGLLPQIRVMIVGIFTWGSQGRNAHRSAPEPGLFR